MVTPHNLRHISSIYSKIVSASIRRRLYHSSLYGFLESRGVARYLAKGYWKVQLWLADPLVERSVGETTARFMTTTPAEYTRFRDPTFNGEIGILESIVEAVEPDDIFYDIGANVGLHAVLIGTLLPDNHIVAVEPHSASVHRLKENLAENGIQAHVCECGFSSTNRTAEITLPADAPGFVGSVDTDNLNGSGVKSEIQLREGDEVISEKELPSPTILKIDVDGFEYDVLKGLDKTLASGTCREVFCEIHPSALREYGHSDDEVLGELSRHGYGINKLEVEADSREDAYFVHATR